MDASKQPSKSNAVQPDAPEYLYDATLIQVDSLRGSLVFKVDDSIHRVTYPHVSSFSVGAIGRLRLPSDHHEFAFTTYPDQRLRRAPSLDPPLERRWGWSIGERQFTVEVGVIPGRAGKVIPRDTKPLTLDVPSEFERFCRSRGLPLELLLTTFMADLCELTNFYGCPREDGFSTSGDDGHVLALNYVTRTWGDDEPPPGRASRRAAKRVQGDTR